MFRIDRAMNGFIINNQYRGTIVAKNRVELVELLNKELDANEELEKRESSAKQERDMEPDCDTGQGPASRYNRIKPITKGY